MSKQLLSKSATIADVVPTLGKAEDYICGVLDKMYLCKNQNGTASVRIGVTGKGVYPAYRIEYRIEAPTSDEKIIDASVNLYGAYGGQTHREFTDVEIHELTWSSASMTFGEVQESLRTLRSVKKFRP